MLPGCRGSCGCSIKGHRPLGAWVNPRVPRNTAVKVTVKRMLASRVAALAGVQAPNPWWDAERHRGTNKPLGHGFIPGLGLSL